MEMRRARAAMPGPDFVARSRSGTVTLDGAPKPG